MRNGYIINWNFALEYFYYRNIIWQEYGQESLGHKGEWDQREREKERDIEQRKKGGVINEVVIYDLCFKVKQVQKTDCFIADRCNLEYFTYLWTLSLTVMDSIL